MSLFENMKNRHDRAPQKKLINEFQVGDRIDTYVKASGIVKRCKKDGCPYLTLDLTDKTGKIAAKIWDNADHYYKFICEGGIYRISGIVGEYMNQKDVRIDALACISDSDTDFDESDFIEKPPFDTEDVFNRMMETLTSNLTSPHLRQLVKMFAEEYGGTFKNHYGAQKIHHAYIGGLLKHTHSMIELAIVCADHYALDKELLIIGALFHDLGKLFEFNIQPAVGTTFEGGLLGHLVIGNIKFLELQNRIEGFPNDLSCKIQHLIISHHGEKEFGSPEVPKIPEAFVLNILDLLDSRLNIVEETIKSADNKGLFSEYVQALGRRLYIPPKESKE
ncbi:MAG: 3'-5' exoribonuclease YhaM family protein [Candidatus Omnitrophota bacterium]